MTRVDYKKLEKALARLQERYADYTDMGMRPELRESDKESIKESLIQRFETCYDTLWKSLKIYLEDQGLPNIPSSPRGIFRAAHENNVIKNLEEWINDADSYYQARRDTTHDYSEEKAENALRKISNFVEDAEEIFQILSEET